MIWVLVVVLFTMDGAKYAVLGMDDEADCKKYEALWAEKYSAAPKGALQHECRSYPIPDFLKFQKERDS